MIDYAKTNECFFFYNGVLQYNRMEWKKNSSRPDQTRPEKKQNRTKKYPIKIWFETISMEPRLRKKK